MNSSCDGSCDTKHTEQSTSHSDTVSPFDCSFVSEFSVAKMDCPAEERLIRMALDNLTPPVGLSFDIGSRRVNVFHQGDLTGVVSKLNSLDLDARLISTGASNRQQITDAKLADASLAAREGKLLKWLLGINAVMFVIEFFVGWIAQSTGLIADSFDMFADAAVYGLALYAVGYSVKNKLKAAHLSGLIQMLLALFALSEVVRRFLFGSDPVSTLMMIFGFLALIANVGCLALIYKDRESGAHLKASWIFSTNDVIANSGVILAGYLVVVTGSRFPDLVIGFIIAIIVLSGAYRILRMKS